MANVKISEMDEATSINNDDLFMIVQGGKSKKIAGKRIKNTYSLEETVIGSWVDGKSLYRKVFEVPATALSSENTVVITFPVESGIDIKMMHGIIKTQTSNYIFPLSANGVSEGFSLRASGTTVQLLARTDVYAEAKIVSGNVVIEYTKS